MTGPDGSPATIATAMRDTQAPRRHVSRGGTGPPLATASWLHDVVIPQRGNACQRRAHASNRAADELLMRAQTRGAGERVRAISQWREDRHDEQSERQTDTKTSGVGLGNSRSILGRTHVRRRMLVTNEFASVGSTGNPDRSSRARATGRRHSS